MIWLLVHPLPPLSKICSNRRHTGRLRKRDNLLTGEREGKEVGEETNNTAARKPGTISILSAWIAVIIT
jgi:hypothetical protein